MLSYVYFGTNDLARAISFYSAVLAPLGMQRCVTNDPEWDRISAGWGTYEDDGAPGLRLHYSPDFYAAYVRDPDGNKIAAVCRGITAA